MIKKKLCLLAFVSLISLTGCQTTSNSSTDDIKTSSTTQGNPNSSTTTHDYTDELISTLSTMKAVTNYTLTIDDYDGEIVQYFNEKAWSFSFDKIDYTAYIEDENGIFPLYVDLIEEDGYTFHLATKEKALCDKLYTLSPVKNIEQMTKLLLYDLIIASCKSNPCRIYPSCVK